LTYEQVIENLNVLDYEYYFKITQSFLAHDYHSSLLIYNDILMRGFDGLHFIEGLCSHFRDLLVCRDAKTATLMETSEMVRKQYVEQAAQASVEFLLGALNVTEKCAASYKQSNQQRLHVELCLLNVANIGNEKKNNEPVVAAPLAVANKPASTAESAPAPIAPAETSKVISIEDALRKREEAKSVKPGADAVSAKPEPQNLGEQPFTLEALTEVWMRYAQEINSNNFRLKNAVTQSKPQCGEGFEVHCVCENTLFYNAICEVQSALQQFLQTSLNNGKLSLSIAPPKEEVKEQKPYLPEEKFNYFVEKNKNVLVLQEKFGLELN
jgi:DNA polymerase-3 subunit gamma/tau